MGNLVKRNNFVASVDPLFDDILTRDIFDWTNKNFSAIGSNLPSVNLKETDNKLEVELAAPGLKKEDFKIEIDNNMLMISSEKEEEEEEEEEETRKKGNYVRKEFNYQSFYRSFYLPEYLDENKIEATYKDGILHVEIAKINGSMKKTHKTIAIK
ncbi:HSP20 family protein [Flavobacterium sp. CG_23.5]|uniref:Hsp20/alpha crystallin family protein n=1 Tax=Flavobacterium sp. CG_23.5 TaxID=2760708 RepID=UPI001AE868AD|nr:Hsp20/alpha crystallin family protein [Flavobacterium sp. CG_23.5]MBP2281982.1 HSP20 family protein [Flavobacterium sp. CG_23.5]